MQQPSFDAWTIIFLIAAVQGYFIAWVLWRWKKGHSQANRLLAGLLFLFALTMTEYVFYWSHYVFQYPHVSNVTANFPFLFGPILFFYFRYIFENQRFTRSDLWHLVPFVLASLYFLNWYWQPAASKLDMMAGKMPGPFNFWVMRIIVWGRIAHLIGYAVWNFRYIRAQPTVASTTRWANLLNGFFLAFSLAYFSYFVLVRFSFFNSLWDYHISAVMTAMIYLIAYAGYVQPAVFEGFMFTEPNAPAKYRNSGLTAQASQSLAARLAELMENEQLYRDPELRLDDLAARLGVGKHHVSQVINEHLGRTFFEYVNSLRLEEARQLLLEHSKQQRNVIEVAYAVGFNNKMSFNNAFKKATGMTPTEFRRNGLKNENPDFMPGASKGMA